MSHVEREDRLFVILVVVLIVLGLVFTALGTWILVEVALWIGRQ